MVSGTGIADEQLPDPILAVGLKEPRSTISGQAGQVMRSC
jgi:hypothetical protein